MIQVNDFLCHHVATKTEGNCDEIGHATFSEATSSDATFSELRRFRKRRFRNCDVFGTATFSYKTEEKKCLFKSKFIGDAFRCGVYRA